MSSSINKIASPILDLSNTIGAGLISQTDTGALKDLINYYNSVDTSTADSILNNLRNESLSLSEGLTDYQSAIDGSDAARQEAQNAVYQSYLSLLEPQYKMQTDDLNTRLLNQGLSIDSQAYQRAMQGLQEKQNLSLNQAAYNAVTAGNNAFNSSFNQALQNANLSNNVRKMELDEIYKLLSNTLSEEEKQNKLYELQTNLNEINQQNEMQQLQTILALAGAFI